MNFRKISFIIIAFIGLLSCDDDSNSFYITQSKQNKIDDKALVKYLKNHYFAPDGRVKAFNSLDDSDDNYTPLSELAEKDPSGYYIVKNNNNQPDNGTTISDNATNKILIQYDLMAFRAAERKDSIYYAPTTIVSTVNNSGLPEWDPIFYYAGDDVTNNEAVEIESFIEGLKKFKAANKDPLEEPFVNFQGLILVPSRLAYGRKENPYSSSERDLSMVLNFEIYQVADRK